MLAVRSDHTSHQILNARPQHARLATSDMDLNRYDILCWSELGCYVFYMWEVTLFYAVKVYNVPEGLNSLSVR